MPRGHSDGERDWQYKPHLYTDSRSLVLLPAKGSMYLIPGQHSYGGMRPKVRPWPYGDVTRGGQGLGAVG